LACTFLSRLLALLVAVGPILGLPAVCQAGDVLEFEALDGRAVRVVQGVDAAVIVHFWASWCTSCIEELPFLDEAADACGGGALRILAVNVGEPADTIERTFAARSERLEVLRDPRGRVWRAVSGVGLPVNLAWTAETSRVEVGPRSRAAWHEALTELGCAHPPAREQGAAPE